jgi:transposase
MSKDFEAEPVLAFDQRKPGKRRAYTTEQKRLVLEEARQPGNSLSAVARKYGISPSLAFSWKRQMDEGAERALAAGEAVVPERRQLHFPRGDNYISPSITSVVGS